MPFATCWISSEARAAADRVLESGGMTTGAEVAAFEAEFAAATGARAGVAVSSCTAAVELSLRALRLPEAASVLVPAVTSSGVVGAMLHAGLRPLLVDVDPATGMPDSATMQRAASAYGDPAAMIAVHWAGDPVDVNELAAAAGVPDAHVVVDAAHTPGTLWHGRIVGSGPTACFSFGATANMPVGEGGMITTQDEDKAAWLRRARLPRPSTDLGGRDAAGSAWRHEVVGAGMKANLTDLSAAIGRAQLAHLPDWQDRRATIATWYDAGLRGLQGLGLPHRPDSATGQHAWHFYPVRLLPSFGLTRDQVGAQLNQRGIGTAVHFPIHRLDNLRRSCMLPPGGLPGADRHSEQTLCLPMHPHLDHAQVVRVCEALVQLSGRPARWAS